MARQRISQALRRANDILGQILLIGFFVIAGVTPLVILIVSILNFARNRAHRVAIVLKALLALAVWGFLTLAFVTIFIMVVVSYDTPGSNAHDSTFNLIFILEGVIYALIGAGLIYWMKRQGKSLQGA